jgi:hypothetical protein
MSVQRHNSWFSYCSKKYFIHTTHTHIQHSHTSFRISPSGVRKYKIKQYQKTPKQNAGIRFLAQ